MILAEQSVKRVARSLHVLVPLTRKDLEEGRDAAERAGLPYYRAVGNRETDNHPDLDRWGI
jgi:hypothetical protein